VGFLPRGIYVDSIQNLPQIRRSDGRNFPAPRLPRLHRVQDSKSYYVTIKELRTMAIRLLKRLRVAGNVQPGSINGLALMLNSCSWKRRKRSQ